MQQQQGGFLPKGFPPEMLVFLCVHACVYHGDFSCFYDFSLMLLTFFDGLMLCMCMDN